MGLSAGKNCIRKKIKDVEEMGKELGEAGRDFRLCVSLILRGRKKGVVHSSPGDSAIQ